MDNFERHLETNLDELSQLLAFSKTLTIKNSDTAEGYETPNSIMKANNLLDIYNALYFPTINEKLKLIRTLKTDLYNVFSKIDANKFIEVNKSRLTTDPEFLNEYRNKLYVNFPYVKLENEPTIHISSEYIKNNLYQIIETPLETNPNQTIYKFIKIPYSSSIRTNNKPIYYRTLSEENFINVPYNDAIKYPKIYIFHEIEGRVKLKEINELHEYLLGIEGVEVHGKFKMNSNDGKIEKILEPLYVEDVLEGGNIYLYNFLLDDFYYDYREKIFVDGLEVSDESIDKFQLFLHDVKKTLMDTNYSEYYASIRSELVDITDLEAEDIVTYENLVVEDASGTEPVLYTIEEIFKEFNLASYRDIFVTSGDYKKCKVVFSSEFYVELWYDNINKKILKNRYNVYYGGMFTTDSVLTIGTTSENETEAVTEILPYIEDEEIFNFSLTNFYNNTALEAYFTFITPVYERYKRTRELEVYYGDFYLKSNADAESNLYYIDLAKRGTDIVEARIKNHKDIINHKDWQDYFTDKKFYRLFMECYNEAKNYYLKTMYNDSYRLFDNYEGLGNMLIIIITISHYMDECSKNISNINYFSDAMLDSLFSSFNLDSFLDLPKDYRIKLARNINYLFINKGSNLAYRAILDIFAEDFEDIQLERYYILKDYKRNPNLEKETFNYYTDIVLNTFDKAELLTVLETEGISDLDEKLPFKDLISDYIKNKIIAASDTELYNDILFYMIIRQREQGIFKFNEFYVKLIEAIFSENSLVSNKVNRLSIDEIKLIFLNSNIRYESSYLNFLKETYATDMMKETLVPGYNENLIRAKYINESVSNSGFSFPLREAIVYLRAYGLDYYRTLIKDMTVAEVLLLAKKMDIILGTTNEGILSMSESVIKALFLRNIEKMLGIQSIPPNLGDVSVVITPDGNDAI